MKKKKNNNKDLMEYRTDLVGREVLPWLYTYDLPKDVFEWQLWYRKVIRDLQQEREIYSSNPSIPTLEKKNKLHEYDLKIKEKSLYRQEAILEARKNKNEKSVRPKKV